MSFTEDFQCLAFWCSGKGKKAHVTMLTLTEHLLNKNVICFDFLDSFFLKFCILCEGIAHICQCRFQLQGTLTGLTTMSLVNNDSVAFSDRGINLVIYNWEFLKSSHDDTFSVIDGIAQSARVFLFINRNDAAKSVVKAGNSCLQLLIQHPAIRYDNDTVENGIIVLIMQAGHAVSSPCDRIGFSGASTMLDEIVVACTVFSDMGHKFTYHI